MTLRIPTTPPEERERGLAAAAAALRRGQLVGLPLDTMYGIAADAFDERGIAALRAAKGRPDLAIPVMVPRIATVAGIAQVDASARDLMRGFWPGPLTLILPAQPTLTWKVADGAGRVGVRMPLHPVALELLARTGPLGVVGASGRATAGTPVATPAGGSIGARDAGLDATTALPGELAEQLAVILDGGPLHGGPPSAVIDLTGPDPVLVRPGPFDPEELRATCPTLIVPPQDGSSAAPPPVVLPPVGSPATPQPVVPPPVGGQSAP